MTAALVIRGTGSVHDVITDIQAIPVPFPPSRDDGAAGAAAGADGETDSRSLKACPGSAGWVVLVSKAVGC